MNIFFIEQRAKIKISKGIILVYNYSDLSANFNNVSLASWKEELG